MATSILNSTKKMLGLVEGYKQFDLDVIMHINTVFGTLHQLGIGPTNGYMIEDDTATWESYLLNDSRLNAVKTYMYLQVRMFFDPPTTSFAQAAMNEQIKEMQWRLNVVVENDKDPTNPVGPTNPYPIPSDGIFDGGRP